MENPAATPAPGSSTRPPRRKHRWWTVLWRTLLVLLLLLVLFHRPILIGLIHAVAVKEAAKQNIHLTLRVEGTVLTNLSLKDIHADPSGHGSTPVSHISIDEVTVEYSIVSLVRRGISEFLKSYTLRNAYIEVKPVAGTPSQKKDLASTLHDLIQQPALFTNRVNIDNLNLVAHTEDGDFEAKGLKIFLDPVQPSSLAIARLAVPKVRTWENLSATGSYANRDLILSGLEIDPQLVVTRLELDASQRARGINRLDVQGNIFGGTADFSLKVTELPGKHANNAKNADAAIDSTVSQLSLTKVSQYFGAATPAVGEITSASIHLVGDPNTPSSWTGAITTDVGTVHAGSAVLDKASLRLDASKGWGTFGTSLFSGTNSVTLQASGQLPATLQGFNGSAIEGWLNISASDPGHIAPQVTHGSVNGDGAFSLKNNTFRANLDLKAAGVTAGDLDASAADIKLQIAKSFPAAGRSGSDAPAAPFDGLQTKVDATVSNVRAAAYAVDAAELSISTDNQQVTIEKVTAARAGNNLSASGQYILPRDMKSFAASPGKIGFMLHAPSLAAFNAEPNLNGPNGKAEASGTLTNDASGYGGQVSVEVSDLTMKDFTAQGLKMNVTIQKSVATIDQFAFALNPTDGLSATGTIGLQKPYAYDAAVQAQIHDLAKFDSLVASLKGNLGGALNLHWQGRGNFNDLRSTGQLQLGLANGKVPQVQAINAAIEGSYSPDGLNFPTFRIDSSKGGISAVIAAQNNALRVNELVVRQAGKPLLSGSLAIPLDLRTPAKPETLVPSNGPLVADLVTNDLQIESFFPAGQAPARGVGHLVITSRGTIDKPDAQILLTGRGLQAKGAAMLAPASLDLDVHLVDKVLSLHTMVKEADKPLLSGSVTFPLDLRTPSKLETLVPPNGPLSANLVSSDLQIDRFFPKDQAPAKGTMKLAFTASGSINQPDAQIAVTGRGLVAKSAATLAPATLDVGLRLIGDVLSVKAKLQQPSFSPVEVAGNLPLPLNKVVQARKIDPQSPLQLSVRLPKTSLGFITRIVPAIRYAEGTAAMNLDIAGTVGDPLFNGAALLDLPAIRFTAPTMPSISGFRGNLQFARDRLTISQFGGDISGGKVGVTGNILFANRSNPQIDLRLFSRGALFLRNENVTVRADADIRVNGPLAAANVTGDVGITQSRFFKQIEILPLELPGRPAPKPPPAPATSPSIDTPPLRDWKFDIKVHTKDPFIIQGNLANGDAVVDLRLSGSGKAPAMEGTVRIENFVASLPFSKLQITNGYVSFSKDNPFIPNLNIQATSTLQDYNINVLIYGTASDPKTVLTSEPPLPQEDIVALLATGATTASLSNGDALAGRAAILVLQGLYHKVFKTKAPPATENQSFVSRFKTDVGGVDPRTGQQEISSRFELTDKVYLIGELDVGGNIRGQLRYLLRFK